MKENIAGVEDMIEEIDALFKENVNSKTFLYIKHPENLGHYEKTKAKNNRNRRTGFNFFWHFQLKGPENIFNKTIEEKFPNLRKDMPIKVHKLLECQTDQTRKESPLETK